MIELQIDVSGDDASRLSQIIDHAVQWVESEYRDERLRHWDYYNGDLNEWLPADPGRHQTVSNKIRDAVNMLEPTVIRPFVSSRRPVEFIPRSREEAQLSAQMTDACRYEFVTRNDGHRILCDMMRDAAIARVGVAKVWWEQTPEVKHIEFSNLDATQLAALEDIPNIEIVEIGGDAETGYSGAYEETYNKGRLRVRGVPQEEFFIDSDATCFDDATCVAHRREMFVSDAIDFGIPEEAATARDRSGHDRFEDEKWTRRQQDAWDPDSFEGEASRRVVVTEAYVRYGIDGGVRRELYRVLAVGDTHDVVSVEKCDVIPFAHFILKPLPHAFYGESIAQILTDDMDAATSLYRAILDNAYLSNQPGGVVNVNRVEVEDILNTELGAWWRSNGDVNNAVIPWSFPFIGQQTLPVVELIDQNADRKCGISRAGMGLSPDALQSTTASAVDQANRAATANAELMVRTFAMGVKRLFWLIAREIHLNAPAEYYIRLRGEYIPVNPASWDLGMDMEINVGLGTGQPEQRAKALEAVLQLQDATLQQMGLNNPFTTLRQKANTIEDLLEAVGLPDVQRYFNDVSREEEAAYLEEMALRARQAQQAGGQGGAPDAQALIAAEQIRARADMQKEQMRIQADLQKEQIRAQTQREMEMLKLRHQIARDAEDDDIERDRMVQDRTLKAAEIAGKHKIAVDQNEIRREQTANSGPGSAGVAG